MSLATLSKIEKTFGRRVIFDDLDLNVEQGERIGFIGANGSGKTTLFKVLTGEIPVDAGVVAISKGTKVGHLSQDPVFDPANAVIDEAELAFAELHTLAHKLRDIEHLMADHQDEALEKTLEQYQNVLHDFELAGGYAWRHKLEATLLGVGLGRETWEQNVTTLSGGQRSRLALARLLIAEPDLLLLDEPTNHLDLAAIEWLENYLLGFSGAVVIISHDRYLLDRLATRIIWLTRSKLRSYPGNYSAFTQQRELQELTQQRQYEEQQADIEKQKEFIRRFGAGQRSKEAKGREKRLNRLLISDEVIQAVDSQKKINLKLSTDQRAGDRVLSVRELSKSYDDKQLWLNIEYDVKRGERVGIIGPNGSGKTTMLEVLLGHEDADAGEVKWGANLSVGYYDQKLDDFDPENTIIDELAEGRIGIKDKELRDVLALMLFRNDDVDKQISLLSGGERARVRLAQLLLDKPNVLLLDEPTNHLDVDSCEALERALDAFPGTVMCVSHDRYFLDRVAKRLLILDPPGVQDFDDNYSAWQRKLSEDRAAEKAAASAASRAGKGKAQMMAPKPPVPKGPLPSASAPGGSAPGAAKPQAGKRKDNPYARPFGRLSGSELEQQITETEVAIAECQGSFGGSDSFKDASRARNLQEELKRLTAKLEGLEQEYFSRQE